MGEEPEPQAPSWRARLRWLGARLGLVVVGLVAGLVAAELLARLVQPEGGADLLFGSSDGSPPGLYLQDQQLLMVPAPGFQGENLAPGASVPLRINQVGLRGPELGPKQGRRWLVVGDSFTMAAQVPEEETFVARLSERRGEEFLNAGVDGYSTWQEARRFGSLDPVVQADGVVLVFFLGNDFTDNRTFMARKVNARAIQQGQPIPREAVPRWRLLLLEHSVLFAQVRVWQRRQELGGEAGAGQRERWAEELGIFHRSGATRLAELERETREALKEAVGKVRQEGDRLLVAVAPPAFVVDQERAAATMAMVGLDPEEVDLEAPGRAVRRILQDLGLGPCELQPALEASLAAGESPYFVYDGHWTSEGHAAVAEAIDTCLGPGGPR